MWCLLCSESKVIKGEQSVKSRQSEKRKQSEKRNQSRKNSWESRKGRVRKGSRE
jgi:hypothetical protein